MTWYLAASLMVGLILAFMAARIPIAFAFLLTTIIGVIVFMGGHVGMLQLASNLTSAVTSYTLVPVPLFLLMGELFFQTGLAQRVFTVIDRILGNLPGRLAYVTIGGGTMFASLSGSSIANVALMGSTVYPEMDRRGYARVLSVGSVVATGALAAIIPPSGIAVLLGSLAGINVGHLLLAGILPGLMLAASYAVLVAVIARVWPRTAPNYPFEPTPLREKLRLVVVDLAPMGLVVLMVIGLIVFGIATPTESAAFGVAGVIAVAAAFGRLTIGGVMRSAAGALKVTGMIFMIILASTTFSQILALSGATFGLVNWVQVVDADPTMVLLVMGVILLILGAFMESVAIMMLTIPTFFPIAAVYGIDPIWLGIYVLMLLEIGLITPPFGLGLYAMLGVTKDLTLVQASVAVLPYILCILAVVALLFAFPQLVTFIPAMSGA